MRSNVAEIGNLFNAANSAGNLPVLDEIYPNQPAPIVRDAGSGRTIETLTWGFPPPGQVKRPVTNVRNLDSPFWRSALSRPDRRCLVPVTAFCEWTGKAGSKREVWFALNDADLFAFAGIWRPVADEAARFAFLTCAPNNLVGAVHPKAMPVILTAETAETWLTADWDEARSLAQPFPGERMHVVTDRPTKTDLFG
jgi:putative SOS response-associated peptidase YedK